MSDVRLSNGSPPLERVDARLADHTRPPVCRNLFPGGGAEDATELRREYTEQLRDMERVSRERWNFDFVLEEPLAPGQYEWSAVDSRSVPEYYSRPLRGARPARTDERAPQRTSPSPSPSRSRSPSPGLENRGNTEDTSAPSGCSGKRKRPSTEQHDSPSQSKREKSDAEETNHCADSSVEQTPRKSQPDT